MALPVNQFSLHEFSWKITYTDEAGNEIQKVLYKKKKLEQLAKKHNVVAADAKFEFPIEDENGNKKFKILNGDIEPVSWQVRGTLEKDGVKKVVKPVRDIKQQAGELLAEYVAAAEEKSRVKLQDLLSADTAKDAISAKLPKGWTFAGTVEFARKMGYDENLPPITVGEIVPKYLKWLNLQLDQRETSESNVSNLTQALKHVRLYFWDEPVQVLLDKNKVQAFCKGDDPIPNRAVILPDRSIPRELATETERPWGYATKRMVAAGISAMMHWARGRYVGEFTAKGMFWYPEETESDPYIMDEEEMRNLLNGAWNECGGRHAARTILLLFGAIRPEEVDSWDEEKHNGSYLNLTGGIFYVDSRRKTGCREVALPMNARLMLNILRKEGRLDADELKGAPNCYRIRYSAPATLTWFHALIGYAITEKTILQKRLDPQRFYKNHPIKYQAGWAQDGPRHTCLDIYFYATNRNAGATSGYAGNLDNMFYRKYKGKLRTDNIPAAVARVYRMMPDAYKNLEAAKLSKEEMALEENKGRRDDYVIGLPPWYIIKDDGALSQKIEKIAGELANPYLVRFDGRVGSKQVGPNVFKLVEHAWAVMYLDEADQLHRNILTKKTDVVALARQYNVINPKEPMQFPVEGSSLKFVNGKIEPVAWCVTGILEINGEREWMRPVRWDKQEAEDILTLLREGAEAGVKPRIPPSRKDPKRRVEDENEKKEVA